MPHLFLPLPYLRPIAQRQTEGLPLADRLCASGFSIRSTPILFAAWLPADFIFWISGTCRLCFLQLPGVW